MDTTVTIPYSVLQGAEEWKNGKVYRVNLVIRQVGSSEDGGAFAILAASSPDAVVQKSQDYWTSDNGSVKR